MNQTKTEWRDISSYRQGDKERSPNAIRLDVGNIRLTVHHYIGCEKKWFATAQPFFNVRDLRAVKLPDAQSEALAVLREYLQEALDALPK